MTTYGNTVPEANTLETASAGNTTYTYNKTLSGHNAYNKKIKHTPRRGHTQNREAKRTTDATVRCYHAPAVEFKSNRENGNHSTVECQYIANKTGMEHYLIRRNGT